MIEVEVYNQEGKSVGKEKLEPRIFGVKPNPQLISQAVLAQTANARHPFAHAKTRGEVRGGGKKPWRQKGTGRARQGSIRSPLWKGGGVTFGPRKNRNFSLKINKKAKRKALFMGLTDKAENHKIILLENFALPQAKTKEFVKIIKKLPVMKNFLTVLPKTDITMIRALNNLPQTKALRADSLNIYDVLRFEFLLMPKESLKVISQTFLS